MLSSITSNWKTSSAGIVLILTGLIHLAFGIIHKTVSETDFTTTAVSIVTGVGLIVAGDGSKSIQAHEETKSLVNNLQSQISEIKGDSATVTKPMAPLPVANPPPTP